MALVVKPSEPPHGLRSPLGLGQAGMACTEACRQWRSFGERPVADRSETPAGVEPIAPFEAGGRGHRLEPPRPAPMDHVGLEQAVDCLGQDHVIAADRWLKALRSMSRRVKCWRGLARPWRGLGEALRASSVLMRAPAAPEGSAFGQGLLQGVATSARSLSQTRDNRLSFSG